MTGKHHLISGTVAGGCVATSYILQNQQENFKVTIPIVIGTVIVTGIGSLFPDIDTKTSKMGKKMRITSTIINKMFGHRGFLHSPIFAVAMFFLLRYIFNVNNISEYSVLYYGFVAGIINHFICDMMTKGGIPLLYPFQKVKFSLTPLKSGSKYEIVSLIAVCILSVTICFFIH